MYNVQNAIFKLFLASILDGCNIGNKEDKIIGSNFNQIE